VTAMSHASSSSLKRKRKRKRKRKSRKIDKRKMLVLKCSITLFDPLNKELSPSSRIIDMFFVHFSIH